MGDTAKPIIVMHCFNNVVEFVQLHKFDTDAVSVQWRTMLLNVMLCGIDALGPLVKSTTFLGYKFKAFAPSLCIVHHLHSPNL